MGKLPVFLLNLPVMMKEYREIGQGFRETIGLRNPLTEEAIQKVIHIVHIVIHIRKPR